MLPSSSGRVVDFCVDRIKYSEWGPILNALCCDLSLNNISIRCRQQVKTVLEQIDCERLAKTVNKRAVILTNFMLSNLLEAISQCLSNTTLLTSLLIEGLPLKVPYLNPLCEALLVNSSLQHLYLSRCLIGDAGCLAVCKAVRCLPNILTLDLSGCELTDIGAGYIAELIKYQKIHRYSENWMHTLRYRLPELDTMAGLRRISVCANPGLGDSGVSTLMEVLADDLWIKALDVQNCGVTEETAATALHLLRSNTALVVLDLRHNPDISSDSMSKIRAALRKNERGIGGQYNWLGSSSSSDSRSVRSVTKNGVISKERSMSNVRNMSNKYANKTAVKKERDYTELLEEQLQDEISHRLQLEELNQQLLDQMKQLKKQQMRLWANGVDSSCSEQSFQNSDRSYGVSSSSGSTSVPIDQNTLSYIQQAFKDIYEFIKNNQCNGACIQVKTAEKLKELQEERPKFAEMSQMESRTNLIPKKAQSAHVKISRPMHMNKSTKSAHLLGEPGVAVDNTRPEMFERQMGDTKEVLKVFEQTVLEEIIAQDKTKARSLGGKLSPCESVVSDSSDTLVSSPNRTSNNSEFASNISELTSNNSEFSSNSAEPLVNPRDAFYSSDEDDNS